MEIVKSSEDSNEIFAFTPERFFFWLFAILAGVVVQLLISGALYYGIIHNLEEGVLSVWLSNAELIVVVALFQIPLFALAKLFAARSILRIRHRGTRRIVPTVLAIVFSWLSASFSLDFMYSIRFGESWTSAIGPIIAAIIGIIDALMYVFLLERIFQSKKVIINDNRD